MNAAQNTGFNTPNTVDKRCREIEKHEEKAQPLSQLDVISSAI